MVEVPLSSAVIMAKDIVGADVDVVAGFSDRDDQWFIRASGVTATISTGEAFRYLPFLSLAVRELVRRFSEAWKDACNG